LQSAEETVASAVEHYGDRLVLSTSFQKEGMIVLDMAVKIDRALHVITLDTGRLPAETYQMVETVRQHYGISLELVSPAADEIERMTYLHGPNLFYQDMPSRMLCCNIRKVRPLNRRLASFEACLTGLRRGQSESRASILQVDDTMNPVKINPLAFWTTEQVDRYTSEHAIPMHPLYAKGFASIGCAPCTRATVAGEDDRSGRWWWEDAAQKECGIHFSPDGRAERTVDVLLHQVLRNG
jgi:phosphoadenosine phosphosulfate reductase